MNFPTHTHLKPSPIATTATRIITTAQAHIRAHDMRSTNTSAWLAAVTARQELQSRFKHPSCSQKHQDLAMYVAAETARAWPGLFLYSASEVATAAAHTCRRLGIN